MSATANTTVVPAATTSTVLVPATTEYGEVIIFNDSSAVLYVLYGPGGSTTNYTTQVAAGQALSESVYSGVITGVWAAAAGQARVTIL